jgi:hypothetical protein
LRFEIGILQKRESGAERRARYDVAAIMHAAQAQSTSLWPRLMFFV